MRAWKGILFGSGRFAGAVVVVVVDVVAMERWERYGVRLRRQAAQM